MKKVSLDLHDFSILRNRLDILEEIKSHFPDFKVSLFTIPFDYEYETGTMRLSKDEFLQKIRKNLSWMQFIPHGALHLPREFENCDAWTMNMYLDNVEAEFSKQGLPMEKGFCAPYWLWNQDVVSALNEKGWWGAVDRNQPTMIRPKRWYQYTHSIDEPFWESTNEVLNLHGHMTKPSSNDLESCMLNILKLPVDTEWHFVTDFINER